MPSPRRLASGPEPPRSMYHSGISDDLQLKHYQASTVPDTTVAPALGLEAVHGSNNRSFYHHDYAGTLFDILPPTIDATSEQRT